MVDEFGKYLRVFTLRGEVAQTNICSDCRIYTRGNFIKCITKKVKFKLKDKDNNINLSFPLFCIYF